jgi:hypothetical protein
MRDMFDDFLEELRRRQGEQRGKSREPEAEGESGPDAGTDAQADDRSSTEGSREDTPVSSNGADSGNGTDRGDDDQGIFRGAGYRGPRRPRSVGSDGELPEIHIGRGWVIFGTSLVVVLLLLSLFFSVGVTMWTDAIWYQSVGYAGVFWTRLGSQLGLFALGALGGFTFLWFNLWLPGRLIPKGQMRRFSLDDFLDRFNLDRYAGGYGSGPFAAQRRPSSGQSQVEMPDVARPVFWGLIGLSALIALGLGGLLASSWTTVQLFAHRVPFGQVDPTFGKDIGFYIFELPFYRLLQSFANTVLLLSIVIVGVRYLVAVISGASMPTTARIHVGVLVMLFLVSIAVGFQLDRLSLVYSDQSGIFQGASYTDVNARFLAINVMTVLAAFAGTLFLLFCCTRWWVPLTLTIVIWLAAYGALDFAYPLIPQPAGPGDALPPEQHRPDEAGVQPG